MAIVQIKGATERLLADQMPAEKAAALADKLAGGTWTHDYGFTASEASELGLPVSTDMPGEVLDLMAPYQQPVRSQAGGVEYLPVPRHRESEAR